MEGITSDLLTAGREALARGEWETARAHFEALLEEQESPAAFEGLARACWWLDEVGALFEARERAYRLYRERGDARGAARVALHLAEDSLIFRAEPAVFTGWTERARRLLEGEPIGPEHAFLAVRDAFFAFLADDDTALARRRAADAIGIARRFGLLDLEMLARSIDGVSLVAEGGITEGMRLLDEATTAATSGEMQDIELMALTCCFMIFGCERARDFDRAAQWCLRVQDFCRRFGLRSMFGVCRAHYGMVLTARGEWAEAEQEFLGAAQQLALRPGQAPERIARLAELRRRQGRLDEAEELFGRVAFHPEAQLGLAALALDRGDPSLAREWSERFLRQVPQRDRTQRAHGLELSVRACAALGDFEQARPAVVELRRQADQIGTTLLRAAAAHAEGILAAACGDLDAARMALEEAVDLYQQSGLPYEAAEARLVLAEAHRRAGRIERALEQPSGHSNSSTDLARRTPANGRHPCGARSNGRRPGPPRRLGVPAQQRSLARRGLCSSVKINLARLSSGDPLPPGRPRSSGSSPKVLATARSLRGSPLASTPSIGTSRTSSPSSAFGPEPRRWHGPPATT